jgi:hypothetical protein
VANHVELCNGCRPDVFCEEGDLWLSNKMNVHQFTPWVCFLVFQTLTALMDHILYWLWFPPTVYYKWKPGKLIPLSNYDTPFNETYGIIVYYHSV